MRRGLSVPLNIDIKGYKFTGDSDVEAIIKQKNTIIAKTVVPYSADDEEDSHISMPLTVQETLQLREGICEVQVKWTNASGQKDASDVINVDVLRILKED